MHDADFHRWMTWLEIGLAALTFIALLVINAPYGRHLRRGWGPQIPSRVGWIVMENGKLPCTSFLTEFDTCLPSGVPPTYILTELFIGIGAVINDKVSPFNQLQDVFIHLTERMFCVGYITNTDTIIFNTVSRTPVRMIKWCCRNLDTFT